MSSFRMPVDRLLEDLVSQLLALDPDQRPNVKQAKQHDWCRKKFPKISQVCYDVAQKSELRIREMFSRILIRPKIFFTGPDPSGS